MDTNDEQHRRRRSDRIQMRTFLAIIVLLTTPAFAQNWSGLLDPARAIDWSLTGVGGGIPTRSTICQSMTSANTAAQINTAITNCPVGQVVFLASGNYTLNGGINMKSGVTLRGAGANLTKLTFSAGSGCMAGGSCAIAVGDGTFSDYGEPPPFSTPVANRKTWTGTNGSAGVYTKGATVLNLSGSTSGLAIGDNLILYQDDDAAPTTGLFICANGTGCSREGSRGQGQQQIVKVTNIAGSAITVTPGIYASNWRTSQNPRVGWWGSTLTGVGIENLSINSGTTTLFSVIGFFNVADSWMKGVATQETGSRDHVMAMHSRNITIKDSFITQSCVGGCAGAATGYGFETWGATSILFENNIVKDVQSPFLFSAASTGIVASYNYSPPCSSGCGTGATNLTSHEEGFMYALYESNYVDHIRADTFHGTQVLGTIYRNHAITNGEGAVDLWAYNRYWNIVANVLGDASANRYECISPDSAGACGRFNPNIYRLGFAGANAGPSVEATVAQDSLLGGTTMRWGNYDTVTSTVRWQSSEVPSGIATYSNPVPTSVCIAANPASCPASLYLSAKPNWWPVAKAWPAIGPDVSGGNITGTGGHANTLPAQDCYTSISGTVANFNAATCYPITNPSTSSVNIVGTTVISGGVTIH